MAAERPVSPEAVGGARKGAGGGRIRRWLPPLLLGALLGALGLFAAQWCIELRDDDGVYVPAPPPQNPAVSVTLSLPLIAALIQRSVDSEESPVTLRNVRADESDGRLVLRGDAELLGRSVPATVELEPYIENGAMRMRVRRSRFGPLPVPSNLERLAEPPLNRELASALSDLPASLTSVAVTDGGLTVTADVRIDELKFTPR